MTTKTRRCVGSERFGIEAHETAPSKFPKQPSRKDGLGTMCTPHWKAYVKGLRDARMDALAAAGTEPKAAKPAAKPAAKGTKKAAEVAKAKALIGSVDAMPAGESAARWADDDVQAAIELVGDARAPSEVEA